ncbi:hypothetical protein ACFSHT_29685 [Paraburkholderia silviterrae]|uniref:Uncharacterized protein n=1 Tax=Paraburkholderia silviterrae TaxID=2528715 RepID=A0A4R5M7M6_9BURK|nr:hypothetical protein [Paraburkholderia silviterrae]TDG22144.1 hypothetical protein EYW47_19900 [Paraburkholderia silviterrae]
MTLLDQEIAHITHAVRFSLCRAADETVLPAPYWRRRLNQLLASQHLTKAQLAAIDSLLRELDTYEAQNPESRSRGGYAGSH